MSIEIVADKYSSAMFELAQEQNKLELMEEQLGYVASVMVDQPELRSFLENPIVTEDAKIKLIGKIFDSSIDKVALHFIYVMIKRGRYRYIASTIEAFIKKSRAARGILEATVTVAEPITADVEASVQAKLREVTGKDVILSVRQDPSIMGGIVIQVGDKRIDGSVARRLEELEKSLLRISSNDKFLEEYNESFYTELASVAGLSKNTIKYSNIIFEKAYKKYANKEIVDIYANFLIEIKEYRKAEDILMKYIVNNENNLDEYALLKTLYTKENNKEKLENLKKILKNK